MKRQFLLVLLIGLSGCLDFTTIDAGFNIGLGYSF